MVHGQLTCSRLIDGRTADPKTPLKEQPTPPQTLHIRDRGFTDVTRWKQETEQEQLELSYLRNDVRVYDEQGHPIDLLQWLQEAGQSGERLVLVGHQKLPMRLLFERVPEQVAAHRRQKVRAENKERGQTVSPRTLRLTEWSVAVTTVATSLLTWQEALVLLRLRWQIELLFKLWKQHGLLDVWRTSNPNRVLCELFAKLIGLLIQHWLLIISCWDEPHRSLVKAAKAVRRHVVLLNTALAGAWELSSALARIQQVAGAGARLTMRRDAPTTSQMLLTGSNHWSNKPPKPWKRYRRKGVKNHNSS